MKRKSFGKRRSYGKRRSFKRKGGAGKFHGRSAPKRIGSVTLSRGGIRL
jgi:hypothetical protein